MSNFGQIRRGRMAADILGEHFTQISNAALRDPRLSFKARGILAWLASHQDGYGCSVAAIEAHSNKDGREAIRSALRELEEFGYLSMEQTRDPETGRVGPSDYLVTDLPSTGDPLTGNPLTGLIRGNSASSQVTPVNGLTVDGKSPTKNTRPKNTSKNIPADFASSSPKVTRGSAHDVGVSPIPSENAGPVPPQAATGSDDPLTLGQMQDICDEVMGIRGDWHAPGIMAELRKVVDFPADVVLPAMVEAAANRAMTSPGQLAAAVRAYAATAVTRAAAEEQRARGREDWRREVHEDVENRARAESRAAYVARLKAEHQAGKLRSPVRAENRPESQSE